jgi:hypothetical protein
MFSSVFALNVYSLHEDMGLNFGHGDAFAAKAKAL